MPYDTETIDQKNMEVRGRLVEGLNALISAEVYLAHGDINEIERKQITLETS